MICGSEIPKWCLALRPYLCSSSVPMLFVRTYAMSVEDGFDGRVRIRQVDGTGRIVINDIFELRGLVQLPSRALIIELDVDVDGIYRARFSNYPRRKPPVTSLHVGGVARPYGQ